MAVLLATGLKTLFLAIACSFGAIFTWGCLAAGNPFTFSTKFFTPWIPGALAEFSVNYFAIGLWIFYKESNYVYPAVLMVLMSCTGSITTCTYIFSQFLKLSPEESAQDPIYHVLMRHEHKSYEEQKGKNSLVVAARIGFAILGCFLIATLIYSVMADGSPFRAEVFRHPWLIATVIDTYFHIVVLLVWVVYKETSWLNAAVWIVLCLCFGSIATCGYILLQLFQLSSQDPLYLVLLKNNSRASRVPLLSSV